MKSRTVAILLALFLGGFGAHRFYLRQPGIGLLYLVFCWTLIPAFIAVGDIIYFLILGEKKFKKRYA